MLRFIRLVENGRGARRFEMVEEEDGVLDAGDAAVVLAALNDEDGEIPVGFSETPCNDACSCAACGNEFLSARGHQG